jgi:RND family efflux transporter MFP subunit
MELTVVTEARRRGRPLVWMALAALAVGALSGCSDAASQQPTQAAITQAKPSLTVGVAAVGTRPMARIILGTGSVAAWQPLIISAEIAGLRLVEVAVEEGDSVKQGQVLARFDDSILKAQAAQLDATALEAEANLANARDDFRRAQELKASRNIPEATYQQRETAARGAEARLAMIRAQSAEVKAKIAQTLIRAPTDGVISKRTALLGAVGSVGGELFRLIRDGRIELQALVPELDIDKLAPGQHARVIHGDVTVTGRIRLVSPVVDAATRLGMAYVTLPPDSGLKPGMFASAEIAVGAIDALSVPQEALVFPDGRPAAFAVGKDNRVALRLLETGVRQNGWVEIRAGLDSSDRIVVAGAGFLNDGDLVRVESAAALGPSVTE